MQMALQNTTSTISSIPSSRFTKSRTSLYSTSWRPRTTVSISHRSSLSISSMLDKNDSNKKKAPALPNSNYVVPLDSSSCITRPLAEILRDLNKRVPDKITKPHTNHIPWYHANRMLSFYAPGWCGEVLDVIFSANGSVTVVYRVTVRGSDGEAHRDSTGTVSATDGSIEDPVTAAEQIAFCRACARFGLGLYLYHDDETI